MLLTFDKDFGELAWRSGLPANCGIVLFRLPALDRAAVALMRIVAPAYVPLPLSRDIHTLLDRLNGRPFERFASGAMRGTRQTLAGGLALGIF